MENLITTESTKQRSFLMLYHDFLNSNLLDNPYEKLVYIYLKKHCNSENTCYPSIKTLANETKISISKVKTTIKDLLKKGIITKENRTRKDGGKTSNLYTLNDSKELWDTNELKTEKEIIIDKKEEPFSLSEIPLEELEKEIARRKNEPVTSQPTTVKEETSSKHNNMSNNSSVKNYKVENFKSQEQNIAIEKYPMEWLKNHYEYNKMLKEHPEEQTTIDKIMSILYDDLNTSKNTIRVNHENKPIAIYISKITKLTRKGILYAIKKYKERKCLIPKPINYIRTLLYNAEEQLHFETLNQENQGESLPSEQEIPNNNTPPNQILGMTKSVVRYNSYSQRQYTQEELDELEEQLLRLAIQTEE